MLNLVLLLNLFNLSTVIELDGLDFGRLVHLLDWFFQIWTEKEKQFWQIRKVKYKHSIR